MEFKDINKNAKSLQILIHHAIFCSIQPLLSKCRKLNKKPHEPDFISALTLNFPKKLFDILKSVFPKNKFSVTGIYCHQKPIVDIGMSKNPEIGDWLLVYIYTDKSGEKKLNSLLLQAKLSSKQTCIIGNNEQHQLRLYTKWPTFTYKRAGPLNGTRRDIQPKTINNGAQYLIIDKNQINYLTGALNMSCATPNITLNTNNDLATEIINFLKFKSGRTFEEYPIISKDDWTKMIWDLIYISKDIASSRKHINLTNFPRQTTESNDGFFAYKSDLNSIFNDLHNEIENEDLIRNLEAEFTEENSSPSILLIESEETPKLKNINRKTPTFYS